MNTDTNTPLVQSFGTVRINNEPVTPGTEYQCGDITIGDTVDGKAITFIWIDALELYIADRNILTNISGKQLEDMGIGTDAGIHVTIDGKEAILRLIRTGMNLRKDDNANEWAVAMLETNTDDALWHWSGVASWGQKVRPHDSMEPNIGNANVQTWNFLNHNLTRPDIGFRPVLIPVKEKETVKRCPKCGYDEFLVTAHVTQDWVVDEDGEFLKCTNECIEVTHKPDDDDIWTCKNCGHEAEGREFNKIKLRPFH